MEPTANKMPQDTAAERAILGAVILNNRAMDDVGLLSDTDFFVSQNAKIFGTMRAMSERNEPIDLVSLMGALGNMGDLEKAGGPAYVAKLIDGVAKVSNVSHYTKVVREKSALRKILHLANNVSGLVHDGGELDSILDAATQGFLDLAIEGAATDAMGRSDRVADASLFKSLKECNRHPILTGLVEVDKSTGGFFGGELVTLTASTGVGKTLLAQQIKRYACGMNLHSMYCSGEMTAEHLRSREVATAASVEHWKMRRPERLDEYELKAIEEITKHSCEKCCTLDGELSLRSIRVAARRRKKAGALDMLIMDYDELIDAPGKNELDQQRELIRGSKRLGMELNVPVIMISQLRKSLDAKEADKPTIEKIYGSGAKSKHSSWIIYIDRKWVRELVGNETDAALYILKARDGRIGKFDLRFNVRTLTFEQATDVMAEMPRSRKSLRRESKEQHEEVELD